MRLGRPLRVVAAARAGRCRCHERLRTSSGTALQYAGRGHSWRVSARGLATSAGHREDDDDTRTHDEEARLACALDLRAPAAWYPLARERPRRVVFHAGPTNSGKTHAALAALCAAPTGLYCGPLR